MHHRTAWSLYAAAAAAAALWTAAAFWGQGRTTIAWAGAAAFALLTAGLTLFAWGLRQGWPRLSGFVDHLRPSWVWAGAALGWLLHLITVVILSLPPEAYSAAVQPFALRLRPAGAFLTVWGALTALTGWLLASGAGQTPLGPQPAQTGLTPAQRRILAWGGGGLLVGVGTLFLSGAVTPQQMSYFLFTQHPLLGASLWLGSGLWLAGLLLWGGRWLRLTPLIFMAAVWALTTTHAARFYDTNTFSYYHLDRQPDNSLMELITDEGYEFATYPLLVYLSDHFAGSTLVVRPELARELSLGAEKLTYAGRLAGVEARATEAPPVSRLEALAERPQDTLSIRNPDSGLWQRYTLLRVTPAEDAVRICLEALTADHLLVYPCAWE
ncbi:hypothetical protein [Levilinea saccharolytica]|uniref:Uncharacterized protein n=1 Tax=Levilinea saccharolytica TaxID=229921 RepID=A0A0N8GP45_9CHLR|nr:hypothetical protein [Levilinea saccharolytica]KPL79844.1 hypothetical protein ADN01_12895 [Levilinea saccharolytica]KPL79874.1 hypothetical protein ADN01_13180 [Levilinea saccharolytica]GAP16890.1 hypothetical protein LSAC_00747 [Levilinea saccharolytica]